VIVMWDDHEFSNDAWREGAENHEPDEGSWSTRAAAARQAFREWQPTRELADDASRTYRSFAFGDLVELWMLDERRYRDQPPASLLIGYGSGDPAIEDPGRTMLGTAQREWLVEGLKRSTAAWKVVGNPVPFYPLVIGPAQLAVFAAAVDTIGPGVPLPPPLNVDDWNGYAVERRSLIEAIAATPVKDVVVLTGDAHESFATDVPQATATYIADNNSIAVEFVGPAVTSPGLGETVELAGFPDGAVLVAAFDANLAANNPWVKYHEGTKNGFGVVEFAAGRTQYDFHHVVDRLDPRTAAPVAASWESVRGTSHVREAAAPLGPRTRPASAPAPNGGDRRVLPATGAAGIGVAAAAAAAAAAALAARRAADAGQ
jgi:alkaline phosphatase D